MKCPECKVEIGTIVSKNGGCYEWCEHIYGKYQVFYDSRGPERGRTWIYKLHNDGHMEQDHLACIPGIELLSEERIDKYLLLL
jgi:hypothetical protein